MTSHTHQLRINLISSYWFLSTSHALLLTLFLTYLFFFIHPTTPPMLSNYDWYLYLCSYWLISTSHTLLWTLRFSLSLLSFLMFIHLHNYTSYALQLCSKHITFFSPSPPPMDFYRRLVFFFILLLLFFVFIHLLTSTSYKLLCSSTMFAPHNFLFPHLHLPCTPTEY